MTRNTIRRSIATGLLVACVVFLPAMSAGLLAAEETGDRTDNADKPETRRRGRRRRGGRRAFGRVRLPEIGLTDAQKKKIEEINKAALAKAKDAKDEDRRAIMVKMRKDIYQVFTREQRQKLQEIRQAGGVGAGGGGKTVDMRLELVTFPENVQAVDSNMNKRALLYHPLKRPESGEKIPLIVLLHGAGGTKKKDVEAFKGNRDVKWVMTPANSKYAAKILVPHSRSHWNPDALNKAVDYLLGAHKDIDPNRIYCFGYSLGGLGTWNWARHSPDRLAAIVPVAFIANQDDLKKMVNLPIWAMVGTGDRRRVGSVVAMGKALKELGSKSIRTTVFEGANHATTAPKAWAQKGLLEWVFAQSLSKRGKAAGTKPEKKTDEKKPPVDSSASAGELKSGEYFITQSWSQEKDYKRAYYVSIPAGAGKKTLPLLIILHGNGGNARGMMRRYAGSGGPLGGKYIIIAPDGYKASWNIVSERSKADDLGFIEAIIKTVSKCSNVRKDNVSVLGNSNGAALVNQIACETKLACIRNYISIVSPLNGYQHDGKNFKAKGSDNSYKAIATPMTGKRLMNVSGTNDGLVPYTGGPSRAIRAKDGKLPFVHAEESIFLWAKRMGYKGKKLTSPTRAEGKLEIFSYLDGNVIHYKVVGGGHGAGRDVGLQRILKFLEGKK